MSGLGEIMFLSSLINNRFRDIPLNGSLEQVKTDTIPILNQPNGPSNGCLRRTVNPYGAV